MPTEVGSTIIWKVNDVLMGSGPTFTYTHPTSGTFTLYMQLDNNHFGNRNDYREVSANSGYSCDQ